MRYNPGDYLDHFAERVEPWSYLKLPYLKQLGWHGISDAMSEAIVRTGPLGSLNAAESMQTALAQAEFERFFATFEGRPVHNTLAFHWARLIEMLQCAELVVELANDERLTSPDIRTLPSKTPREGVGCVEAPRGLLTHHYITDENGIVQSANLIVGTTYQYPAIQLSVQRIARALVARGADLPTEAQYEYVAGHLEGRRFPWGQDPPESCAARRPSAPIASTRVVARGVSSSCPRSSSSSRATWWSSRRRWWSSSG